MSATIVSANKAVDTVANNPSAALSVTASAGNAVILCIACITKTRTVSSIADSAGNSGWVRANTNGGGSSTAGFMDIWWNPSLTGSITSVTITYSGTTKVQVGYLEVSGLSGTVDVSPARSDKTTATTTNATSATTTNADDFLVAGFGAVSAATSIASPFTLNASASGSGGAGLAVSVATVEETSTGTYTCTFTSPSEVSSALMATFKVATGLTVKSTTDSASGGAGASNLIATYPRTDASASSSDASTQKVALPRTESASGSDASLSRRPTADAAAGADASTQKVTLLRTDSASGTDASLNRRRTTDSATGADASTEKAVYARTETGTTSDGSIQKVSLPRTDTGSGSDASTLRVSLPRTDSATGTDSSKSIRHTTETGTGADASTLKASYPRIDAASGVDASGLKVSYPRTDTASGSDASTEKVTLARTDAGTASDASVSRRKTTDAASGTDASTLKPILQRADSASGVDASTEKVLLARTDSAAGVDHSQVAQSAQYVRNLRSAGDFQELTSVNHITYATSLDVAAGNSIIVPVMLASGTISSISDNSGLGLTWVIDKAQANSVYAAIVRAYCPGGLPAGTQVTVNFSGTPAWSSLSLHEVSVANASPDASGTGSGTGASWSATASGSTSAPGTLTIGAFAQSGTSSPAAGSGYTDLMPGTQDHFGLEYKTNAATGTFTASETSTGTPNWAGVMAAYGSPVLATLKNTTDSGSGADTSTLKVLEARTDTGTVTDTATIKVILARSDSGTGTDTSTLKVKYTRTDSGSAADASQVTVTGLRISVFDNAAGADHIVQIDRPSTNPDPPNYISLTPSASASPTIATRAPVALARSINYIDLIEAD